MPIEALDIRIRKIAFGRVLEALSRGKGIAVSVEDETASGRTGERNGDGVSDGGCTTEDAHLPQPLSSSMST